MKTKQVIILFAALVCGVMLFSLSAFAESNDNLVPYTPSGTQVDQSVGTVVDESNGTTDYAGQLFQGTELSKNETVSGVVNMTAKAASALITLVLGVITSIITISMVIDICCLLIEPLTGLLSKLPIKLFSREVSAITGVQYVGNTEGAATETVEKVDLKGKPAFFYYIEKKALLIIPALILLTLLGTGLLFDGIFFVTNKVVGLFDNLLH